MADDLQLEPWPVDRPEADFCQQAYFAELAARFPQGFDNRPFTGSGVLELFLLVRHRGEPRGCGMLMRLADTTAELKRMWVHPSLRGQGVGRQLLQRLEAEARARGFTTVRLDTHPALREAVAMYQAYGYKSIPPYNTNPYAGLWFEKRLAPA